MFPADYLKSFPPIEGADERISQKQVGGKLFPDSVKPSDAKRLRKVAISKSLWESITNAEQETLRSPEVICQVPIQKSDDSRKRPHVTTAIFSLEEAT